MVEPVDLARLGDMEELDAGAYGTVYRLASTPVPGFTDVAYKQFTVDPGAVEIDNLVALVRFREQLDPANRAILDAATAWPLRLVTRGARVCGFLMQLIPPQFFGEQRLPSGRTVQLPVKSQWLVVDPDKGDAAGITVPGAEDIAARIVLCAKLAHVFGVLHRAGLVYGDLSLNNVVYSAGAPPQVMLVDCDAVQAPGPARISQAHTDDWLPPECVAGGRDQDLGTDRYKLALFILRVLTPGPHASQSVDPSRVVGVLDLAGNNMMRDGLSADRARRPSAKAWFDYLAGYLNVLTSPPRFGPVSVDSSAMLAGSMITVRWQVSGAHRVVVAASDGHRVDCDARAGQCRVAVTRTGPVILHAQNQFGQTTVDTRPVFVLQPPIISRIDVPRIALPFIELAHSRIAAALRPAPPVPAHALPITDIGALRDVAIPPWPDVLRRGTSMRDRNGGTADASGHIAQLRGALARDAHLVVSRARAASAAAAAAAGESVP